MFSIEEKGEVYKQQLSGVQEQLTNFGNTIGWEILGRGRKPNAGVFGKIAGWDSSIQVTAVEEDWQKLPEKIEAGMESTLWCGVYRKPETTIKASILRHASFENLEKELELFLNDVRGFLEKMEENGSQA